MGDSCFVMNLSPNVDIFSAKKITNTKHNANELKVTFSNLSLSLITDLYIENEIYEFYFGLQ